MAEEENFEEGVVSFVPYVIQMDNALDDEDGEVEVKPCLPVPMMIFDEVERQGPDEIIDLAEEEEACEESESRLRRGRRRESGKYLEKGQNNNNNIEKQKKKKKKEKKQTSVNKTTKEVNRNDGGGWKVDGNAKRVYRELSETRRKAEQLLKENAKLSKENEALRMELELNEDQLTRMTSESQDLHAKLEGEKRRNKNLVKTERKRAKAIIELSSLNSQEVSLT